MASSERERSEVGLSELIVARQSRPDFRGPDFRCTNVGARRAKSPGRQSVKKLLAAGLGRAGVDPDKPNPLLKKGNATVRSVGNARAETTQRSSTSPDVMRQTLKSVDDHVQQLAGTHVPAAPSEFFLLDTADEISASAITLSSTHAGPAPEYNWATFFYEASADGDGFGHAGGGTVSFGFRWKNPLGPGARVTVHSYLVLDGDCGVFTDGGLFVGGNFSNLWIDADLFIHELWHDPPTSPLPQATQSQRALDLELFTWGFFEHRPISCRSPVGF